MALRNLFVRRSARGMVPRRLYGFFKLQEWLDDRQHEHLLGLVHRDTLPAKGYPAIPMGYQEELKPKAELRASTGEDRPPSRKGARSR